MLCKCRNCDKTYPERSSRSDIKGYCSQICMTQKAQSLGWRKPPKYLLNVPLEKTKYGVLSRVGQVGNVPVEIDP